MTFKTNVPSVEVNDTGVVIPSEDAVLQGVLADFNAAFGGNMNLNLDTPQGQLASSLAAIIADKNNQIARIMNQVHPDYAEGVIQDAVAAIYFLERKPEIEATAVCEFMGLAGTLIPNGFVVQDQSGLKWTLTKQVVIDSDGVSEGVVSAPAGSFARAGTIDTVIQYVQGLNRVTNRKDSNTGRLKESRIDFMQRRKESVAINSVGTVGAVYAKLYALPGVSDVYVVDNPKNEQSTVGGVTLSPHSIYAAVVGGNNQEIAEALWKYAGSGCDFNGNTVVNIEDSRYEVPRPQYQIKFQRPTRQAVYFRIRVASGAEIGFDTVIKKAVVAHFNSSPMSKIGASIYSADFFRPVIEAGISSSVRLLDIQVGASRGAWGEKVTANIDKIPFVDANNIEVVVE